MSNNDRLTGEQILGRWALTVMSAGLATLLFMWWCYIAGVGPWNPERVKEEHEFRERRAIKELNDVMTAIHAIREDK